jgi:hypothetical protein
MTGPLRLVQRGPVSETGEQVRRFGFLEGSAWVSAVRAAGIADDESAGTGVRRGHEAVVTA